MSQHRRTVRHPCSLVVRLVDGGRSQPAIAADVSEHGLFVRTDEHWIANALVRLHVQDPEDPRPLALLGIVARWLPSGGPQREGAEGPGIGVSLFGNGREVETRWRALVRRAAAADAGWREPFALPPGAIDAVRRAHTRRSALLAVEVEAAGVTTSADLLDVSEGGALLRVESPVDVETSLRLRLSARKGEAVELHALAVRAVPPAPDALVGVRFIPLAEAETAAFADFLRRHAPVRRSLPAFLPSFPTREETTDS
ncbi:MAG: PilZ domain-containing protein [Myxococcales bacterium]|nr:PilZ domain-containing protein [Myxococcales bacterium]